VNLLLHLLLQRRLLLPLAAAAPRPSCRRRTLAL
jgi:hypothetical protein